VTCFVTFLYGGGRKYRASHVNALQRMLAPHRLVCVTDMPEGVECETRPMQRIDGVTVPGSHPNNFHKLQAFSREFQESLNAEWIIGIDLDVVIREIPDVLLEPYPGLTIMEGTQRRGRGGLVCNYNSSLWACRPGECSSLWDDFTIDRAQAMIDAPAPFGKPRQVGSDQRWIAERWPGARKLGAEHGIVQFARGVPHEAKMIFFAGETKPWSPLLRASYGREYRKFHDV